MIFLSPQSPMLFASFPWSLTLTITLTLTLTLTLILTQISRISRIFFVHEPSARRSQFHGFERKPLKPRSVLLALRASF